MSKTTVGALQVLCTVILCSSLFGQRPSLTLEDVAVGMPREAVVSGLSMNYNVQKVEGNGSDVDMMAVFDKGVHYPDPKAPIRAWIMFEAGRVYSVDQHIASRDGEDVTTFVQELFRTLYPFATPAQSPNTLITRRTALVTLELEEIHYPQMGDAQMVKIKFGDRTIDIMVHTGSSQYANNVELTSEKP